MLFNFVDDDDDDDGVDGVDGVDDDGTSNGDEDVKNETHLWVLKTWTFSIFTLLATTCLPNLQCFA